MDDLQRFQWKRRNLTSITLLQTRLDELGQDKRNSFTIEIVRCIAKEESRKNRQLTCSNRHFGTRMVMNCNNKSSFEYYRLEEMIRKENNQLQRSGWNFRLVDWKWSKHCLLWHVARACWFYHPRMFTSMPRETWFQSIEAWEIILAPMLQALSCRR